MKSMPPLHVHTCLPDLVIKKDSHRSELPLEKTQDVLSSPPTNRRWRKPRWERRLPKQYTLAMAEGPSSLSLKVEIQTTDTAEVFGVTALLDSGATGSFIDLAFAKRNRLTIRKLLRLIPVYNVDSSPNEAGSISGIVDVIL